MMNYVKKMCILRQIKQGFSADGKPLTGLVKVEQYGKNLAVEVSIINFAPLSAGEYYCLLSDGKGRTEMLALRGKSLFNLLTDMEVGEGFCAVVCHVRGEVTPIAYGVNGSKVYDWRAILNATLPPVFPKKQEDSSAFSAALSGENAAAKTEPLTALGDGSADGAAVENGAAMNGANTGGTAVAGGAARGSVADDAVTGGTGSVGTVGAEGSGTGYDDERVADGNYYEEKDDECKQFEEVGKNARSARATEKQGAEAGVDLSENVDAAGVLRPFASESDGYYLSVKEEIDRLFAVYPRDFCLQSAFEHGEWVRVKGTERAPQYLVGVLYQDGKAKYICYALAAQDRQNPPQEIKGVCAFVPSSVFEDEHGFFVIFQSAASGECVKPNLV